MKIDLTPYSADLQETETKLANLLSSMKGDLDERSKVAQALSLVQQARKALSEPDETTDSQGDGFK
jgi:hypothetical protein